MELNNLEKNLANSNSECNILISRCEEYTKVNINLRSDNTNLEKLVIIIIYVDLKFSFRFQNYLIIKIGVNINSINFRKKMII